jgi:hypothetical protein
MTPDKLIEGWTKSSVPGLSNIWVPPICTYHMLAQHQKARSACEVAGTDLKEMTASPD